VKRGLDLVADGPLGHEHLLGDAREALVAGRCLKGFPMEHIDRTSKESPAKLRFSTLPEFFS